MAVELGGAGAAQALAQPAHHDAPVAVVDGAGRRAVVAGRRNGHRITLERIDRRADTEALEEARAVAGQAHHHGVGLDGALVGLGAGDAPAVAGQPLHRLAVAEDHALGRSEGGEARGELVGVARFVLREEERARELLRRLLQRGLGLQHPVAVEALGVEARVRHPGLVGVSRIQ